jgi:hypothetical protein
MKTNEGLKFLQDKYSSYDFFDSVGLDQYGRYIVYVHFMNETVYSTVQKTLDGKQVNLWFANSKPEVVKQKYNTILTLSDLRPHYTVIEQKPTLPEPEVFDNTDLNMSELSGELDRLERVCGVRILGEIFFEVHDGHNALTDYRKQYPDVFKRLQILYDDFGFDVLYEELEL